MKILVIGSGGREHALCWKLAQSEGVEVFACPGNPGMARVALCLPGEPLDAALRTGADLTVVGPEVPLVGGIVDAFRARGLRIVGPNAEAARLEGSKIFAKDFFQQRGIPTAAYATVDDASRARTELGRFGFPVVLKADGLAAGKGVVVAHNAAEAEAALGTLKGRLVIEEFLTGEEVSFIALCDGRDALPLAASQDHKAVFDGDQGPNTGGMGAYCDAGILSEADTQMVMDRVIYPTVEAMNFTGFLYAGLMMTADGPKVLEFNVRLGDPETQPLMHRMESDFVPALLAASEGKLAGPKTGLERGPECVRGTRLRRLSGRVRNRQGNPRPADGGSQGRHDLPRRNPHGYMAGWRLPEAAYWVSRLPGPICLPPSPPPTKPCATSNSKGCTTATISGAKAS